MGWLDAKRKQLNEKNEADAALRKKERDEVSRRHEEDLAAARELYMKLKEEANGKKAPLGLISVGQEGVEVWVKARGKDLFRVRFYQDEGTKWSRDCEMSWGDGNFTPTRSCFYGVEWTSSGGTHFGPAENRGYGGDDDTIAEFMVKVLDGKISSWLEG